ncbi:hypothetical protein BJ742DRAFT_679931 [Cladochytrium replicatum]|nr:hypothetical protein BJ742DRAFT_679931 [Cladochytrium replicatum]
MPGDDSFGNKYGRPDLDRIGLFSELGYISSGEQYVEKRNDSFLTYRTKGKQFQTNPSKRGHDNKDAYFDREFIRVFENEPYTDLVVLRRRWRLKAKEKNISTNPFKPSSVPPKPSGSGSLYGTIEQQWPINKKGDFDIKKRREDDPPTKERPPSKPNFYTKPPKQGTGYGYPNVTIGKPYEYVSDPFDRLHQQQKLERELHKQKQIGERTFISSSSRLNYFNQFIALTLPGESEPITLLQCKKGPALKYQSLPIIPFKPSSCCGYTINKYPTHETPAPRKDGGDDDAKRKDRPAAPNFRPSGVSKSYPSRSIIEANCPIAAPPWVQQLMGPVGTARTSNVTSSEIGGMTVHHTSGVIAVS